MMKRKLLITNALPYANGPLHLGHMVGYIQADIWVRFQKMQGLDCTYICGSDCHGTPIMLQAEKLGITPETLVTQMYQSHKEDFRDFLINFDNFYTTHSPENQELSEALFKLLASKNHIAKHAIKQFYDPVKKLFLPDRYIKGECPRCHAKDQYGDNCESCGATYQPTDLVNPYSTLSGAKPIEKESDHYFFKLQEFEPMLQAWTRAGHVQPEVANKLNEWFKEGLKEWDISRDEPYFGFKIPGEDHKYFYCWLDAPVGYMASFKNLCERQKNLKFDEYWAKNSTAELYHFIGKDIMYFHTLFWPAVLSGSDHRTPTAIFVNGFLTIQGQKMSKSRGTFIKARTYLNHIHPEYLRYYFAAKLSDRIEDLDLQFDDFSQRVNADLVGKFVNIASRTASFLQKYFNHQLSHTLLLPEMFNEFSKTGDVIKKHYEAIQLSQAMRHIMSLADKANQFIDEKKPWAAIKDPTQHQAVHEVCTMGINLFRLLALYLKPVLPVTAEKIEKLLNIPAMSWEDKNKPLLNHTIQSFEPLMQRLDPSQLEAMKMSAQQDITASTPAQSTTVNASIEPIKPVISVDDFAKIDLRVAKILHAEHVEGADKLLRLELDIGQEKRQVFAGIKSAYAPEQLIGRLTVVVANLAPRQMRFGESQGMVIVAVGEGKELWLLSPDSGAKPGMRVK